MKFKDVLARFADVSEETDGYLALCPAHGDSRPSLRVWVGEDRKVRLACRAGCETADVIAAASLEWTDLFDVVGEAVTVPAEKPKLVGTGHVAGLQMWLDELGTGDSPAATYAASRFGLSADACDELGLKWWSADDHNRPGFVSPAFANYDRLVVPLFDFSGVARGAQGRDLSGDCPGRWVSLRNPSGHRWAAYGVFRGSAGYGATIVTEGPGDALTAVAVGYDAVAVRGASLAGSPELIAELANGLRGTQVIVAGDNDAAGQGFSRRLAEGLSAHGIDVFTLDIPHAGDDLTDYRERDPEAFAARLHSLVKMAAPVRKHADAVAHAVSQDLDTRTGADTVSTEQGLEAARVLAGLIERYGDTDAMNAHALVAWTDGRIRYAPGLGFYVWTGRFWERSEVKVRQEIHRMGAALMLAGKEKEARPFAMTKRIDDLMTELRSVPSVYVDHAAFDNDSDEDRRAIDQTALLNFRNGTVDLRTGALLPHSKEHMLTYCLRLDYVPSALCPRWDRFLTEVFPDQPEMPAYMQRLVGYGVSGSVAEQCFCVLWGKGKNGKSVFTDTLTSVFRAITKTTGFATFEDKQSGGIPNDIAALRGSRLVMASEGEAGKPMSESVLKRASGKDMMSARFLRQEFFEFKPSFLILLATNHKPKFRGQDEGLWRRVRMIPFTHWFAPHERETMLDEKLLAEAEGIAAWAVRGAREWYAAGLQDPEAIISAVREYRETSDALAGFYSEDPDMPAVLVKDDSARMDGGEAFNSYLDWCEAENLPARERWTRRTFYSAMEERRIMRTRTAKGMALVGVRLTSSSSNTGPGIFAGD